MIDLQVPVIFILRHCGGKIIIRPKTDSPSEEYYNQVLRRSDLRFLLSNFTPQISICSAGGLLHDATDFMSNLVIDCNANQLLNGCDLFVARNPSQATLEAAFSTLKPGGNLYVEWTVNQWIKSRVIKEKLSNIGFDGIFLYLPKPDPSHSIPTIWVPLEVPGAIEFLIRAGYPQFSAMRFTARIGNKIRRFLWRLIPRLFLSYPWLLSSGLNKFSICSICCKPEEKVPAGQVTATSLKFLKDYVLTGGADQAQGLSALMLADSANKVEKVVLLIYQGRSYTPCLVVKASRTHVSADLLDNENKALQSINEKYGNIERVPKILYSTRNNEINVNIQTVVGGAQLSSILNRSNYRGYAGLITDWLVNLAMNTKIVLPKDWYAKMVLSVLSDLDSLLGKVLRPDLINRTINVLGTLEIPCLICEHRDFGPQNIFMDSDNNLGVIDWEFCRLSGIPALDLIFFLTRTSMMIQGAPKSITTTECYKQMIDCNTFTGTIFYNCLNCYMNRLDISQSQIPALRLMTWIVHYCWRMFYDKINTEQPLVEKHALNHWALTLWMEELSISGNL